MMNRKCVWDHQSVSHNIYLVLNYAENLYSGEKNVLQSFSEIVWYRVSPYNTRNDGCDTYKLK